MKIQCPCGTKYSFDVTPEMARTPIRFICQNCGVDSSELVNQLIREHLAAAAAPAPPAIASKVAATPPPVRMVRVATPATAPAPPTVSPSTHLAPPPPATSAPLRVKTYTPPAATESAAADTTQPCLKHRGQVATQQCLVCQKPICPKCMESFGYVCSAYCKGKAEDQGIDLPVYEHQKFVAESREWRKVGLVAGGIAAAVVALLGAWGWYAWVGSVPRPKFSVRFADAAFSGQCRLVGQNQLVFLHGGTLARHDMKAKKEVWSQVLIDRKKIAKEASQEVDRIIAARAQAIKEGRGPDGWYVPSLSELVAQMQSSAEGSLHLYAHGENVWVSFPEKFIRFDWQTGRSTKEIPVGDSYRRLIPRGNELLLVVDKGMGGQMITRLDLASGETRTEEIVAPHSLALLEDGSVKSLSQAGKSGVASVGGSTKGSYRQSATGARRNTNQLLSATAPRGSQTSTKPLDPSAIAARAQNLALPERLALPATISAKANQQRLQAEMDDDPPARARLIQQDNSEQVSLIPDGEGFVQFAVKLIEEKSIAREAMKAPPKKSALEGTVNAAATATIANEILNEIQRDRVGSTVVEDVSRYQVTLRRVGAKEAAWSREVVGPPDLFPLQTVDVVAAGKSVLVLDKSGKKRWESQLNYPVAGESGFGFFDEKPSDGEGPCVERDNTLYVFDQGVLTAFDLATGNARWRLPSVGVAGLHFDDKGMIYVNTTTASHESIKYSRQIDITRKTRDLILKVDAATGKTLWQAESEGLLNYVSGKFVYTLQSHAGDEPDDADIMPPGVLIPPHIRIKRLDPDNGHVMWEHYQRRAPVDVQFEKNTIHILFKKEMQVLRFLAL